VAATQFGGPTHDIWCRLEDDDAGVRQTLAEHGDLLRGEQAGRLDPACIVVSGRLYGRLLNS
jgi:hypothetical protein